MQESKLQQRLKRSPHRNKEYWRDKVAEWERSNESQKEFCARLGIKLGTFSQLKNLTIELLSGHKFYDAFDIEKIDITQESLHGS